MRRKISFDPSRKSLEKVTVDFFLFYFLSPNSWEISCAEERGWD